MAGIITSPVFWATVAVVFVVLLDYYWGVFGGRLGGWLESSAGDD